MFHDIVFAFFGPRSGYKDRRNHAHQLPFPGVLRLLSGIAVEDLTMVTDPALQWIQYTSGQSATAPTLHEILRTEEEAVEVLARYTDDYYKDSPAITSRTVGAGRIVYCGTFFTLNNVNALLDALGVQDSFADWGVLPSAVEAVYREDPDGKRYAVIMNFASEPARLTLKHPLYDYLSERWLPLDHELEAYGVRWLAL
jgi:beta-galactosidase